MSSCAASVASQKFLLAMSRNASTPDLTANTCLVLAEKLDLPSTTSDSKTPSMRVRKPAKKGSRRTSPISLSNPAFAFFSASPSFGTSSSARRVSRSVRILAATLPGLASIGRTSAPAAAPPSGAEWGAEWGADGRRRGSANIDVTASTSFPPAVAANLRRHSCTSPPDRSSSSTASNLAFIVAWSRRG